MPSKVVLAQCVFDAGGIDKAGESLDELACLADTAGLAVVGCVTQRRSTPHPAYLFGSGKVGDLSAAVSCSGAGGVIFDNPLSPGQASNLSRLTGCKTLDRCELILYIFARRARSAEARIQVELAQLRYQLSRVSATRKQHRFKGNIGMRGPGESPLQVRNVPMRARIRDLSRELERIRRRRAMTRCKRKVPLVCAVGYTNAGKSSLVNALTRGGAYVDNSLFATLDTTSRQLWLGHGRKAVLVDTVGFIRNLPHALVAAFRSTLEVAVEADLLLIVVDAAHPDSVEQLMITRRTLREIGAAAVPSILVLNKADSPAATAALLHFAGREPSAVPVSARQGTGLDRLRETINEEVLKCCVLSPRRSAILPT